MLCVGNAKLDLSSRWSFQDGEELESGRSNEEPDTSETHRLQQSEEGATFLRLVAAVLSPGNKSNKIIKTEPGIAQYHYRWVIRSTGA